jgi:hypothetical protein
MYNDIDFGLKYIRSKKPEVDVAPIYISNMLANVRNWQKFQVVYLDLREYYVIIGPAEPYIECNSIYARYTREPEPIWDSERQHKSTHEVFGSLTFSVVLHHTWLWTNLIFGILSQKT